MPPICLPDKKAYEPGGPALTGAFFAIFCILPVTIVLYVFYGEEVRTRLENDLFDIRSRVKPQIADTSDVAVVTISQKDIAFLEGQNAQIPSYENLTRLISKVMESGPLAAGIIIPHHDLDYESQDFYRFIRILERYKNLYFGSFDLNFREPSDSLMPDSLLEWKGREFGAGTVRHYRREIIRSLPLMSYRDEQLVMHLNNKIASDFIKGETKERLDLFNLKRLKQHQYELENMDSWEAPPLPKMYLNYIRPELFTIKSAEEVMNSQAVSALSGRLVLVGYTAYRKRTYEHRDGTYVNTPWEWDGNAEVFGSPLIYVLANQLQNMMTGSWLVQAPFWANVIQTGILGVLSFVIWRLPPVLAVLLFCFILTGLIWIHGLLFAFFSYEIPLADTVLIAVLSTIAGAFIRAHHNSQILAKAELRAISKKKLAMIQSRFLNRFANELFEINSQIGCILISEKFGQYLPETARKVWHKACSSCDELRDYLAGIQHYSSLAGGDVINVSKSPVALSPLIQRILGQFDSTIEEFGIVMIVDLDEHLSVWTDELILEPVLFNLISNAIKYSPARGRVHLLVELAERGHLRIRVRDEGPGIDEEFHGKIFEKFYRVKNDQVYKVKGNGLGLYLCRYFADKIAADINLISSPGKGSEFILTVESCHG